MLKNPDLWKFNFWGNNFDEGDKGKKTIGAVLDAGSSYIYAPEHDMFGILAKIRDSGRTCNYLNKMIGCTCSGTN